MGGASLRPRPAFTMMRAVCVAPGSQGGVDAAPVWPSGQRSPRRVPRPALPRCPPGVLGALPQLPLSFVPAEQATLNPEAEPLAGVRGPCKEGAGRAQSLSPCMLASFGGGVPGPGGFVAGWGRRRATASPRLPRRASSAETAFVIRLPGLPANRQVQLRIPAAAAFLPGILSRLGRPGRHFLFPQLPPLLAVGAGRSGCA